MQTFSTRSPAHRSGAGVPCYAWHDGWLGDMHVCFLVHLAARESAACRSPAIASRSAASGVPSIISLIVAALTRNRVDLDDATVPQHIWYGPAKCRAGVRSTTRARRRQAPPRRALARTSRHRASCTCRLVGQCRSWSLGSRRASSNFACAKSRIIDRDFLLQLANVEGAGALPPLGLKLGR